MAQRLKTFGLVNVVRCFCLHIRAVLRSTLECTLPFTIGRCSVTRPAAFPRPRPAARRGKMHSLQGAHGGALPPSLSFRSAPHSPSGRPSAEDGDANPVKTGELFAVRSYPCSIPVVVPLFSFLVTPLSFPVSLFQILFSLSSVQVPASQTRNVYNSLT